MQIGIISFTQAGRRLAENLAEELSARGCYETESVSLAGRACLGMTPPSQNKEQPGLQEITRRYMEKDAVVFIGACGIAVRAVAPYIRDKRTDPAVIVMDEKARFVIPLLSGHMGGANELGGQLASLMGGQLVLTTATDVNDKFAIDVFAKKNGLYIYSMRQLKQFSAALLDGGGCGILFTNRQGKAERERPYETTAVLVPKNIYIGLGCRRGKTGEELLGFLQRALSEYDILKESIAGIASIDIKRNEGGILSLAEGLGVPSYFYSADELGNADGDFTASDFVTNITGVDNVCERSACIASEGGRCLCPKKAGEGMTIAIYEKHLRLEGLPDDILYSCDSWLSFS